MINFNVTFGNQNYNYFIRKQQDADFDDRTSCNTKGREVVTSWKYDEEGNIVYYTYDKKTGEVISKTKYKNPYKGLIQQKKEVG